MDGLAVNNTLVTPRAQLLSRAEDRIDNAYQVMKVGRVALGDAPISLGTTAIGAALRLTTDDRNPKVAAAISDAGLVADGVLRALFYKGGLLHAGAARHVPWLVSSRAAPAGWGGVARGLAVGANLARGAMLGITGTLGAMRAAKAVSSGGWEALYDTKAGRSGALQAAGAALLIVPHPITRLTGAAMFAAELVNDLV